MNEFLFLDIFNRSLTSCWLILAVFVLRFLLKKAPGYFRIILWIIVGIRLILPFDIRTDFSLVPSAEPLSPYTVQYEAHPSIDTGVNAINDTINPVFSEVFKADPESSVNPLHVWVFVIGCAWLIGFVILLAYSVISYLRFCGMLKDAVPEAENILISDHIDTPFVLGIINPKIYLPSSLGEKDKAHVLAHERKHIQRKDHILKPAAYLITALHWFNPLVWISYILFCGDLELSCDEAVIKEMDLKEKKDYALALLNCQAHRRTVLAYPLAFGETDVKERVTSILSHKKPAFWLTEIALIICVVTALCFLSNPNPKHNPDASYLIDNFDWKDTDKITIYYDWEHSESKSDDGLYHSYCKEAVLADLDPKDQKRIIKQIESILTDEEFEEVSWDETRGGSQYRLLILDVKQVNITVYQKEGYIGTKDPESDIAIPLVYKVNNDKLDKLCDLVDEATAEIEPS